MNYVLAVQLHLPIKKAADEHKVSWELVSAIIGHESEAFERRAANFVGGALSPAGAFASRFVNYADLAERAQVKLKGDSASIGIAQMQVSWAKRLRGKFPSVVKYQSVVDDLLTPQVAVRYVAAGLHEINDQLTALLGQHNVSISQAERNDLLALGYNIGWDNLRDRNLLASDMGPDLPSRIAAIRKKSKYIELTMRAWRQAVNP